MLPPPLPSVVVFHPSLAAKSAEVKVSIAEVDCTAIKSPPVFKLPYTLKVAESTLLEIPDVSKKKKDL